MFLTDAPLKANEPTMSWIGRNPLKSGQCFLLKNGQLCGSLHHGGRRNPLKSGQCFLQGKSVPGKPVQRHRRNPLKSGQCFLLLQILSTGKVSPRPCRNPLKSGQCFLHIRNGFIIAETDNLDVAIPSNRVNVSYSTHLFLRIIGNLTPLLREPHYFYASLFPI